MAWAVVLTNIDSPEECAPTFVGTGMARLREPQPVQWHDHDRLAIVNEGHMKGSAHGGTMSSMDGTVLHQSGLSPEDHAAMPGHSSRAPVWQQGRARGPGSRRLRR